MDFPGYQCYRLNIFLLCLVGIWPYEAACLKLVHRLVMFTTLLFAVVSHIIPLFSEAYSTSTFLKNAPGIIVMVLFYLKYVLLALKSELIKETITKIKDHWEMLREEEVNILKTAAEFGKRSTIYVLVTIYVVLIFTIIIPPFLPFILNSVMRINVSYTYRLPNDVDLVFVKRDRYVIALFMCLDIIAVMLIISTELFSFMFILHIRGLYTIAIRRIKKGMAQSLLTTSSYDKYIIIYDSVAKSMETYKSMIQCRIHFKQTFLSHYFCMYLVSVVFPATTLLRIMQAMTDPDDNINNIVLGSMSLLIFTGFVYILNYLSQLVIDDNDEFFDTPYNTEWYEAPLPAQKLLLFIMRGRTNNTDTNLYGMYKPSMQGISTHMKISWSYFMTLYSIR